MGSLELIFGLHRLQACKELGWKTIPCYVYEVNDAESFLMSEIENLQRNDYIDAVKEAEGFRMLTEQGMTEKQIGERIAKSQQYISSRLSLLRLPIETQQLVSQRILWAEHAYEISKIDDPKMRMILTELSRRDVANPFTLQQLREAAKKPLSELASQNPRVDAILLRDPAERIKRLEGRFAGVDEVVGWAGKTGVNTLRDWVWRTQVNSSGLEKQMSLLTSTGSWKRDRCEHFNGEVCNDWSWSKKVEAWDMKEDNGCWRLTVKNHPEYCTGCPTFKMKAAK